MSIPAEIGMTPVLILVPGAMQNQTDLGSPMHRPKSQAHAKPSHKYFQVTGTCVKNRFRFSESSWPYLSLQPRFLNWNPWKTEAVKHQGFKNLNLFIITARWPYLHHWNPHPVLGLPLPPFTRFWNPESWSPPINRCGLGASIHTAMKYELWT